MTEDGNPPKPSVAKLENDLKAIEEQALLYAQDLARIFIETKEKEKQLELTKQQLERSARIALLGELAAGIAHEINNILTPATGNLSILLVDRNTLPKKVVNRLELIEQSLMKASSMLQQVLDLSRKKPEKREAVDIGVVLEQCLSLLKYKFLENGVTVEQDIDTGVPKLYVDRSQIGQVFTNLSLNAIDAMEQGGALRIAAAYHPEGAEKKQPYVQILFEDTGCGISPDVMDRVFEPFYTTKESSRGTGLGLFICHGIVQKHGGTIDVAGAPDGGTQFTICLPID
jgi:two-component system NtrC family sensor kinase